MLGAPRKSPCFPNKGFIPISYQVIPTRPSCLGSHVRNHTEYRLPWPSMVAAPPSGYRLGTGLPSNGGASRRAPR